MGVGQSLLEGLKVEVDGEARPLHVAARWLADLGATVTSFRPSSHDPTDEAWLGTLDPPGDERGPADLLLLERGVQSSSPEARTTVVYSGTGSRAGHARQQLNDRSLAAVGGVAVAIGDPDRAPLPLPDGCLDAMVGTHLAAAGLAALLSDTKETEVAGVDVVAWAVATNLQLYLPYGLPWYRAGRRASGSGGCYPYGLFDAADGLYCLIGRTDRDWISLRAAMGEPAWADTPEFRDPRVLGRRYPWKADAGVDAWTRTHTRADLTDILVRHAFPGGPVLRPEEVIQLPSVADRWRQISPDGRQLLAPGPPFDVAGTSAVHSEKALRDLFVLDLSWVWSGPAVGVALADLGATVVKVESATRPDNTRLRGRPETFPIDPSTPALEVTPYFHGVNRGKRSVSLNLATEGGRSILWKLATQADVIVENLTPGVMARFGIAPDRLLETNPGCVFLSMPGYGGHPSTAGLRAYAPVLSAGAGIESLVAYPGEAPVGAMTFGFSDANAASAGLVLALAGLFARRTGGGGSAITLSQFEAAVFANGHNLLAAQLGEIGRGLEPIGATEAAIVRAEDLGASPWVSADLLARVRSPWLGEISVARLPWRQDGEFPAASDPGPAIGAHTDEVLRDRLSLEGAEIAALRSNGSLT
jgi:crotonobetainyl-CoA:carnitine CoA-transferase CaiB-like acyl-CoA transferase